MYICYASRSRTWVWRLKVNIMHATIILRALHGMVRALFEEEADAAFGNPKKQSHYRTLLYMYLVGISSVCSCDHNWNLSQQLLPPPFLWSSRSFSPSKLCVSCSCKMVSYFIPCWPNAGHHRTRLVCPTTPWTHSKRESYLTAASHQ